jgi:cullin 1
MILLDRYLDECAYYTNTARIMDHIFRYLNRHWVRRELHEGKKSIYDVYTLHLVLWHGEIFGEISHLLVDAVSELVEKHRKGEIMEFGTSKALIEFFVSIGPDGTDISIPIRDDYGNLLETPLRIAIEASDSTDPPAFLYERPVTSSVYLSGPARTEMEERLITLILHSGFKQPLTDGGHATGTVKLVPNNLAIIEVGK